MCQKLALLHIHVCGKTNHYTFGPVAHLVTDRKPVSDLKFSQQCNYVKISKNTRLAQLFEFLDTTYLILRKHSKEG